jgi:DNA ligase-1
MKSFQPLLAETCRDISSLRYPVMASPKLDGIRCIVLDGRALTRKLKPIPNEYIRTWVEANLPEGIDGEIMLRDHRIPLQQVNSAVTTRKGEPDFVFHAFDLVVSTECALNEQPFEYRFERLKSWVGPGAHHLKLVSHWVAHNERELDAIIQVNLADGYEGTMVRDPHGRYKFGRSTLKEGILLKIKPWDDEEATVIDVVEAMHNENEAKIDERGYTKRSTAKAGKTGKGMLGTLVCVTEDGVEFEIGTFAGVTEAQRIEWWREHLGLNGSGISGQQCRAPWPIGHQVKFKHLGRIPGSNVPRGAVFLDWRLD